MAGIYGKKWTCSEATVRSGGYSNEKKYHIHIHTLDEELYNKIVNIVEEYEKENYNEMEETTEEA